MPAGTAMLKPLLKNIQMQLKDMGRDVDVDDLETIVLTHACSAAVAAAASGWIPGAGGAVAMAVGSGFVIAMYVRLGAALGVHWNKGMIKAIVSAVAADVAAFLATTLGVSTILTFIPVLNLGSSAITAITNFAFVYLAAIIYVKLLSSLLSRGVDLSKVDTDALKEEAKKAVHATDMNSALNEAKSEFKHAAKNGDLRSTVKPDEDTQ